MASVRFAVSQTLAVNTYLIVRVPLLTTICPIGPSRRRRSAKHKSWRGYPAAQMRALSHPSKSSRASTDFNCLVSTRRPPRTAQALMPSIVAGVPVTSAMRLRHPGREAHILVLAGHDPIQVIGQLSHQCSICLRSVRCNHGRNLRLPGNARGRCSTRDCYSTRVATVCQCRRCFQIVSGSVSVRSEVTTSRWRIRPGAVPFPLVQYAKHAI